MVGGAVLILMEHPKHGRMHVYSEADQKKAELIGWTVVVEKPEQRQKLTLKRKPNGTR